MRIAHVSDIHIRNLRYHDEYREVFKNLYDKLRELHVDLIVNTGDTAHTKVQISPEFVQMATEFFTELGNIAETIVILGNHDLNLNNSDRLDAISPIIENINNVRLIKETGLAWQRTKFWKENDKYPRIRLWNYGITDEENHGNIKNLIKEPSLKKHTWESDEDINVGLFHGSVFGAVVDSGFELQHYEAKMDRFEGMDFVMLGDIHKRQSFLNGRAWYAGSLIQQNFGEDHEKGFLLWDIKSKDDFEVTFHELKGSRGFYTIRIGQDLKIPDLEIPKDARIRAVVDAEMTLSDQKNLARDLKQKFLPKDVVSITSFDRQYENVQKTNKQFDRNESYKDKLAEFVKAKQKTELLDSILEIDQKCNKEIFDDETTKQSAFWRINSFAWNNLFNYGSGNIVDLQKTKGLIGIFAPNGSGKSSLLDVFLQGLFDKITKDVPKNIDLINDNRDSAEIIVNLSIGDEDYVVERKIERIKFGQRKYSEAKEWGKTTLSFYKVNEDGKEDLENGISRSETEKQIRSLIGTFDDFVMTSMVSQSPIFGVAGGADVINCKETDRKKILFKFLGLDQFEAKSEYAKSEMKKYLSQADSIDPESIAEKLQILSKNYEEDKIHLLKQKFDKEKLISEIENLSFKLQEAKSISIPQLPDEPETLKLIVEKCKKVLNETREKELEDNKTVSLYYGELADLVHQKPENSPIELKQLFEEQKKLSQKKSGLKSESEKKLVVLNNMKKTSDIIGRVPCEGKYSTCQFLTDAFLAREKIPLNEKEYESIKFQESLIIDESNHIDKLIVVGQKYLEWEKKKAEFESKIKNLEEKIILNAELLKLREDELKRAEDAYQQSLSVAEEIKRVTELKLGIKKLESDLLEKKKVLSAEETAISLTERAIVHYEITREEEEKSLLKLEELKKTISAYEIYVEAMGKHGIPYEIMTGMLPLINEEINRILSQFVGFKVFLDHDQTEQTVRLYIQYNEFKSRTLSLAGGAEKFIASLALRVALINISRLPKTNILIIDEGFGKLDAEMMDSVQKMLEYLKTVFDNVFVISHVEAMKDMVDSIIEINVDEYGYAHVEAL